MIAELERYHGAVLRQILVAHGLPLSIGVIDAGGRVDAFKIDRAAFIIKHSSKRLSPWQFTFTPENLSELLTLKRNFTSVWIFLVCGQDGVVGVSMDELGSLIRLSEERSTWLRVRRSRKGMYRLTGPLGDLGHAKSRGVQTFLAEVLRADTPPTSV